MQPDIHPITTLKAFIFQVLGGYSCRQAYDSIHYPTIEGKRITRYHGVVTGEAILIEG
jgi:hypothetical protein